MPKRTVIAPQPSPPKLVFPRDEVKSKLTEQLEKGREIQQIQINSPDELNTAWAREKKWIDYVSEMLQRYFDNEAIKEEFAYAYGSMRMAMDFYEEAENFTNSITAKVTALESIIERLDLIPDANIAMQAAKPNITKKTNEVFIVHGHEEANRMNVVRFIESIGLKPIVLHEQASDGKTIIEKLEYYSDVGFAVVVMSPDDMGYPVSQPEKIQPRARQNVLVELGFFVGKLSRKNVCVLYTQGVELPTDFLGVVYVALDSGGGWKFQLAREIKSAGLEIDLNKAV